MKDSARDGMLRNPMVCMIHRGKQWLDHCSIFRTMSAPKYGLMLQPMRKALRVFFAAFWASTAFAGPLPTASLDDILALASGARPAATKFQSQVQRRDAVDRLRDWPVSSAEEEARIAAILGALLSSGDRDLQHNAAMALGKRGHVEFLSELFARLDCEPWLFRAFYFYQPNASAAPPDEMLRAGLLLGNAAARECIVEIIGWRGIAKFRDDVEQLLDRDSSETVRRESALALHRIGSVHSAPVLQRALEKDPRVDTAFQALGALGNDEQVPTLVTLLGASDSQTRARALDALAHIKVTNPEPVIAALLRVLEQNPDRPSLTAASALAQYKDKRALPFLRQLVLNGRFDFLSEPKCARAIANLDGPESLALLHEMVGMMRFRGGDVEDALVQRADPSSGPVVWAVYLQHPVRLVISGWCGTTGGYTKGLKVLSACADKALLEKIRARALEATEYREKQALTNLVAAIEQRLFGKRVSAQN
jgi:HEAT repeat protein/PBS lyase HEAT-like repeat-containing protein